ncbi:MAG: C39 family peptidase, partial [Patescibacteria group bacterium]|nr:C39 family peptidase [Patescibacteria group bacterium]
MNSDPLMKKTSGIKLEVPYYSQFLDVEDKYWMPRACGMACAKMVLDFYKVDTTSLDELIKKGSEEGGYG